MTAEPNDRAGLTLVPVKGERMKWSTITTSPTVMGMRVVRCMWERVLLVSVANNTTNTKIIVPVVVVVVVVVVVGGGGEEEEGNYHPLSD